MSPVTVATMMRSISLASTPANSSARRAAAAAMSEVVSPSAAMWRSLMPVRLTIQGPFVATIFSRSALVRIFKGAYAPVPRMTDVGKFSGLVGAEGEFMTTRRATRRLARGSSPSPFPWPGVQWTRRSRGFIPANARRRSRDANFYT